MAFKKSLVERLLNISKFSASQTMANCRISSSATRIQTRNPQTPTGSIAPDPGDNSNGAFFRRFLHKRSAALVPPEIQSFWIGQKNLTEKIKEIDISKDRIRLDGLSPPRPPTEVSETAAAGGLTGEDVRKLLWVAQMEMVKTRLKRDMGDKAWITYSDFVRVCGDVCLDPEQGIRVANMLDQSGSVIVLGNVVYLKPERAKKISKCSSSTLEMGVTKAIEGLISLPGLNNKNDPKRKELKELETQKGEIDKMAESLVRRELWAGLGFMVLQTAGFMRLTFWELSWDVMEPICFYVTSMYFMAGYTFFLRTSKEPSFEGFYQSRFSAKQKKLMNMNNFDVQRYNELKKNFYPTASKEEQASSSASATH